MLFVLQGIDAAGKDSTVKHVFSGTNPQGVRVFTYKEPTPEEAAHDFLWRYHRDAPAVGMIHVFNRSHYEDVLVVRVKDLIRGGALALALRLDQRLRAHPRARADRDRQVLPAHLQGRAARALPRADRARDKHYKFSANDVRERRNWDAYQEAYEDAVNLTSTPWAPWYVVPSDRKWYRNLVVARIVEATLRAMKPCWPQPDEDLEAYALEELEESASSEPVGERLQRQLLADVEDQPARVSSTSSCAWRSRPRACRRPRRAPRRGRSGRRARGRRARGTRGRGTRALRAAARGRAPAWRRGARPGGRARRTPSRAACAPSWAGTAAPRRARARPRRGRRRRAAWRARGALSRAARRPGRAAGRGRTSRRRRAAPGRPPSASALALSPSPRLSRAAACAASGGTPWDWSLCASALGGGASKRTGWQRLAIVGSTCVGLSVSRSSTT